MDLGWVMLGEIWRKRKQNLYLIINRGGFWMDEDMSMRKVRVSQ